jgi:hypothetical protein
VNEMDDGSPHSKPSGDMAKTPRADQVVEPNEDSVRTEYSVEWSWPAGGRTFAFPKHSRKDAEYVMEYSRAKQLGAAGRLVQRTIATSAWTSPEASSEASTQEGSS